MIVIQQKAEIEKRRLQFSIVSKIAKVSKVIFDVEGEGQNVVETWP